MENKKMILAEVGQQSVGVTLEAIKNVLEPEEVVEIAKEMLTEDQLNELAGASTDAEILDRAGEIIASDPVLGMGEILLRAREHQAELADPIAENVVEVKLDAEKPTY